MGFFDKKNQKKIRIIWGIIAVLVIISMVLLFTPIFLAPSTGAF